MSDTHLIYLLTINDVPYVGQASNFRTRKNCHLCFMRNGKHYNSHIQAAYRKYGKNSVRWKIVERNISTGDIDDREQFWIAYYDSYRNGFNQTPGGKAYKGITCIWNGVGYSTIAAAAEANGVSDHNMGWRLKKGYTCDADIPGYGDQFKKVCRWNSIEYPSILAAARANGVDRTTMSLRLRHGHTCDIDVPSRGGRSTNARICVWNGIEYPSVLEAARANGVGHVTMHSRLRKGYTCDNDMIRGPRTGIGISNGDQ